MASDRTLRWSAFGFAVFFVLVVALGYIPQFNGGMSHVEMSAAGEHSMMGLYMIGAADDVTHGLSALLLLIAALTSARASRVALTAFGWYYGYDAAIYLVTGFVQRHAVGSTILLNLPHVIIAAIMLTLAYRRRAEPQPAVR
jgi:predicted anti-sigma-YlaC factor YlaD